MFSLDWDTLPPWERAYLQTLLEQPQAHFAPVKAAMQARGVKVPTLPQPLFLPQSSRSQVQHQVEALAFAFESAVKDFFLGKFPSWLIPLHAHAREVAGWDAEKASAMFCARFDGFFDPKEGIFRVMECNAGDPSGAGFTDTFLEAMRELPAMRQLRQQFHVQEDILLDAYARLIGEMMTGGAREVVEERDEKEWGRVDGFLLQLSDAVSLVHDEHRLIVEGLCARGFDVGLADPRDLQWDGESLRYQGRVVQGVIRDTIDELLLEGYWPQTRPLFEAYRAGKVRLVNPFCTMVADFKGLLEPLSDEHYTQTLPFEVRDVLSRSLPWTRVVREDRIAFEQREVDLLALLREQRERFVLKPNEGYGGYGVVLGRECSEEVWLKTLESALERPGSYVAQQALVTSRGIFLMEDQQGLSQVMRKNLTLSAWVHQARFVGCFARIAEESVINVHQGGALLPVVFVG